MITAVQIAQLLGRPEPTPEQQSVIEADLAPALVVAGAGSGKTETMAGRVVWLVANGRVRPDQVLGLTFTRKAAGELDQRIRARLRHLTRAAADSGVRLPDAVRDDAEPTRPTVSTYNAYAGSLVADHGLRLGLEPASRLLGEAAQYQMVSRIVETWPGDLGLDHALSTVTAAVLALSGSADDHLLDVDDLVAHLDKALTRLEAPLPGPRPAAVREVIASLEARRRLMPLVREYREQKRSAAVLDYADQVGLAARIARRAPQVGEQERERFAVVLLDEYQDTSFAQVELLRSLFGQGHPVTAVGDPHQSIYGWRGASAGGLARFPAAFPTVGGAPAVVRSLATSWRNDEAILRVANRTAAPLRASSPVRVPELAARPGAGAGEASAQVLATVADEADAVAEFIVERRARRSDRGLTTTAAVLCRTRSQFDLVAEALRARGLPVEVVGLGGLLTSPEVVDLVSALQVTHDPSRGDAAMRLLTGAKTQLGLADLHALAAWADELGERPQDGRRLDPSDVPSIVDAIDDPPPAGWRSARGRALSDVGRARVRELGRSLAAIRSLRHLGLPELVGYTERLLGLDLEVQAAPGTDPGRARSTLDALANVAASYQASVPGADLGGFLSWLEVAERREDGLELPVVEPDPEAVQVATVHAAKGLEWDVVAVPGLVDGTFPTPAALRPGGPVSTGWLKALDALPFPARGDRDDLPALDTAGVTTPRGLVQRFDRFASANGAQQVAEERRLAYVAFTRARESLLLTAAVWGTRATPRQVSPFLVELRDDALVRVDRWADPPTAGEENPFAGAGRSAVWPSDPFATSTCGPSRRDAVRSAADAVLAAVEAGSQPDPDDPDDALVTRLLAEDAARRRPSGETPLPPHLAASSMVRLAADLDGFAVDLRRPVPTAPSDSTRRGTEFHAWVEAYYGRATLVDLDALPGADDDLIRTDVAAERLRDGFLSTPWADLSPVAVEQEAEVTVAGITVRARIDAVFRDPGSTDPQAVVVVDWKTGSKPSGAQERSAREVQLAVYRLAWARQAGLRLDQVRAAFCYVRTGTTVMPERLADADELAALIAGATETRDERLTTVR